MYIVYAPAWRDCTTPIRFYLNTGYSDIPGDVLRFAITDSGNLIAGDAHEILHQDILNCFKINGDVDLLCTGLLYKQNKEIYLCPIACKNVKTLVHNLKTFDIFLCQEYSPQNWNIQIHS